MRTIDATLLAHQKAVIGRPAHSVVIGASPTVDVSAFLVGYEYEEVANRPGHIFVRLDNSKRTFNTLTGTYAPITHGAPIALQRGLHFRGLSYLQALPRIWIEKTAYEWEHGQSLFLLECLDAWGRLEAFRYSARQTWANTSAQTILSSILSQVGLTLMAGTLTALDIDFEINLRETARAALVRLMAKLPESLYPGLSAEMKWKTLDPAEASAYTFGYNPRPVVGAVAQHPVLDVDGGTAAWEYNTVTVKGKGGSTATVSDATQVALVGTRRLTIYDNALNANAECTTHGQAELDYFRAEATEADIRARPAHGLELYDVLTVDNPPWGGADITARVIHWREEFDREGKWEQNIQLGAAPEKFHGKPPLKRRGRRKRARKPPARRSRRTNMYRRLRDRIQRLRERIEAIEEQIRTIFIHLTTSDDPIGVVPIGGIIAWSGAVADIPVNWALCDGGNGTPDLRDRFLVGAGGAYAVGATGGLASIDTTHQHGVGTLANANDAHNHGVGTLANANDTHNHAAGTLATSATTSASQEDASGTPNATPIYAHTHPVTGSVANATHAHTLSGNVANDTHTHTHTGSVANAGATAEENRPPYYALCYIMRVE